MKQHIDAEVVVLDRLMYLLEENSVSHLVQCDANFKNFIYQLYNQLSDHSRQLQVQAT